jgi:hypothetical protein
MFWKINFMKKLKKLIYRKRTVLKEFLSVIENQCIIWEPIQPQYLFPRQNRDEKEENPFL